jgi:FAD/FMN-containing dehydrogenase
MATSPSSAKKRLIFRRLPIADHDGAMSLPRPNLPTGARQSLEGIVGAEHVLVDPAMIDGHERDWTGRFRGATPAVVRPADTAQVARVLELCDAERIAVVAQGGNTGLVGGGVPLHGELVLSLRRLDAIEPVDEVAAQVTAGAGVTLEALQDHVTPYGLAYGVDLAARGSATVGGTIATNAGGMHVLRWGATRRQVVGIEAVIADGRVLRHMDGIVKDNTGYDLAGLLCGSEGTLAVVTAARLALVPLYRDRVVALCAFADVASAVATTAALRRRVDQLDAAELFLADGLDLVCEATGRPHPFAAGHPVYVLFEASGPDDPTDALAAALADQPGVIDVAVASDGARRAELWAYREEHTSAINGLGPPHKLDVALPLAGLAAFTAAVPGVVAAVDPAARCWIFGHVGDGNLHVNVTGVDPDDEAVDDAVLSLVVASGGSISAEHGIGTAKRRWLPLQRSAQELAVFRSIKGALDPNGILNPHVLL